MTKLLNKVIQFLIKKLKMRRSNSENLPYGYSYRTKSIDAFWGSAS